MLNSLTEKGFEVIALHHAEAILVHDMPEAITEIEQVLGAINLPMEELVRGGGGEGQQGDVHRPHLHPGSRQGRKYARAGPGGR